MCIYSRCATDHGGSSAGIVKEIQHYKWKEKDGAFMDEPVKFRDDAMDAASYGYYSQRKSNTIIVSTGSYDDERWWE